MPKTVLIFQKPELYYFPHYKGLVFPPFDISERSFRYLIYKALYLLNIPFCSVFWGDWKKRLREAEKVIIFDYGYQKGMETYIRKVNPDCEVYLFVWNTVDAAHKNHTLYKDKDAIYSTDRADCCKYGFKYNHIFYPREFYQPYDGLHKNELFFIGVDKGRGEYLLNLKKCLESSGLSCDVSVVTHSRDQAYREQLSDILAPRGLSYTEYCERVQSCGVLLDVVQEGQSALTMRVLEAIYYSKKLITNNRNITQYDFYQENNIYLLPENGQLPSAQELREFLDKPFVPYPEEILEAYSFEHWLSGFSNR